VKAEYIPYLPSAKENTVSRGVRFEIQRDKFVTQLGKPRPIQYFEELI